MLFRSNKKINDKMIKMKKTNSKLNIPNTVRIKLSGIHQDKRGKIINISNELIRSCALIKSKKNSIRANHYHKKDWHYCYVLKGKLEYYYRNHGTEKKIKKMTCRALSVKAKAASAAARGQISIPNRLLLNISPGISPSWYPSSS